VSERGWAGIAELDPRLRGGALSRVELCSTLLAWVERLEARLNAFITLDPEQPREAAAGLRARRLRGGHSLAVGLPLVGRP
jgi:Asp-tRNA(Asn)/Glu-tRNA(Gln) amidotransferase A subunit family amidase